MVMNMQTGAFKVLIDYQPHCDAHDSLALHIVNEHGEERVDICLECLLQLLPLRKPEPPKDE